MSQSGGEVATSGYAKRVVVLRSSRSRPSHDVEDQPLTEKRFTEGPRVSINYNVTGV